MAIDVSGYSYFIERREADKRWVATVTEFPDLTAESRIHNRALNDLQDRVRETVLRRLRAGEPIPKAPQRRPDVLKALGLS